MSFFNSYSKAVARQHTETGMNHGDFFVTVEAVMEEYTRDVNDVQPEVVTTPEEQIIHPQQDGVMPRTTEELECLFEQADRRAARPDKSNRKNRSKETNTDVQGCDDAPKKRSRGLGEDSGEATRQANRPKKPTSKERKEHKKTLKKLGGGYRVRVKLSKVVVNDSDSFRPG